MSLVSRMNPGPGFADFWHEFRRPNPYRWPILGLSVLMTSLLLFKITTDTVPIPPERPKVTYITSFPEGRSDAEILASNIENQKRQDERRALEQEQIEKRKEIYRSIGRATGLDVDEMERKIAEEEAREAAEKEASMRRVLSEGQPTGDQPVADITE
ncbi:MAG: hypothetical protein H6918_04575 [Sphingomonadaceae bacterium]|nr:hypothetical protein [Sphingomonadaceae bacterium]